jgi:cell division protein FtsW (lipid II flippase)
LGWIAFLGIIIALLFFIVKGFSLCFKQKSSLGLFVSLSIMITFTIQMLIYVVFNLGFQLISPLSLPLISYGNTATVINLGLIGLMLSVFRTGDMVKGEGGPCKNNKLFSWNNGKLTIDFKVH